MRLLTWHLSGTVAAGAGQRESYRLDGDYTPVRVWLHLGTAPSGSRPLIVDMNVGGGSIFAVRPSVQAGETDVVEDSPRAFAAGASFHKDALVTLDIDQVGSGEAGKDLTVGLELEEA